MLTSGKVSYEIGANVDATSFGGIAAVHRLVTKLGLVDQINDGLRLLKIHLPYHESDHVLNMAYNLVCGGTRLEDIERLRHDTAYMDALGTDLIPDPTTAGDFCRRFAEQDVVELMDRINAVRPQMWKGRDATCSARSPTSTPTARSPRPPGGARPGWRCPTRGSGGTRR